MPAMEIRIIEQSERRTHLALVGCLDIAGVSRIDTQLHRLVTTRRVNCLVDLTNLDFLASLGIGLLVQNSVTLRRHGARLVLMNPQPSIRQLLETTNISNVIPVVDSVEEAEEVFATASAS